MTGTNESLVAKLIKLMELDLSKRVYYSMDMAGEGGLPTEKVEIILSYTSGSPIDLDKFDIKSSTLSNDILEELKDVLSSDLGGCFILRRVSSLSPDKHDMAMIKPSGEVSRYYEDTQNWKYKPGGKILMMTSSEFQMRNEFEATEEDAKKTLNLLLDQVQRCGVRLEGPDLGRCM